MNKKDPRYTLVAAQVLCWRRFVAPVATIVPGTDDIPPLPLEPGDDLLMVICAGADMPSTLARYRQLTRHFWYLHQSAKTT